MSPYGHRTFGQTPALASLSQIQPTAINTLQEVTAFFSPAAHGVRFQAHLHRRKENTTEETGNTPLCHREGKFAFLFMSWDDDTKTAESSLFPPLVFSVSLAGFKEIDNTHHNSLEGLSCIQIVGSTTAYSVASLKLKISSVHLIKFTEAAAQKKKQKKTSWWWYSTNHLCLSKEVTHRVDVWSVRWNVCDIRGGSVCSDCRIRKIITQLQEIMFVKTPLRTRVGLIEIGTFREQKKGSVLAS